MKSTVYIILFFILSLPMHSQENEETTTLDSILSLIDNKKLTIKEKLDLGDEAAVLPYAQYTKVLKRLIHYGKQEKDKSSLINTYCTLYNTISIYEKDVKKGKAYLDSAYALIDKTDDPNMKGTIYYCLGKYHANLPESEELSHENMYKAIRYFEQSGTNNKRLLHIYFILGNAYINRKDMVGTKKIIDKMTAVKIDKRASERVFLINVYSVIADYYDLAKANDSIHYYSYNDSIIYYSKKIINTYESLLDSVPGLARQKAPIVRYYNELALAMADTKNPDWEQVMVSLEKGKTYIDSTAYRDLMKYYSAKGRIFLKQNKFYEAKASFLKEKELLVDSDEYDDTKLLYIQLCLNLSSSCEGLRQYKEALLYTQMAMDAERKFNEQNKYETVKDIETKYETAEKELEISRLNEEKQETRFKISLMLSVGILTILSLFFAFLYNRIKRLRKEKEAILLTTRINEKELENQAIVKESELKQMRHYLDGLEVERNRLSKDLHDVVANKLYILDQNLKDIDHIPKSIFDRIEDLYNQTRNISHELISPSFQYATLPEILFNFIEETGENTTIQLHLNMTTKEYFDNLPMPISHEIYRIIQGSTGNIIKHSSAQNAWINLSYSDNNIYLEIKDDGEGFDIQKQTKGIGLQIIQNRCNSLNGNLMIDSEIGKGSSIRITIPVILPNADE